MIITLWRLVRSGGHFERCVFVPSIAVQSQPAGELIGELDFVVLVPEPIGSRDYQLVLGEARGMNDYGEEEVGKIRRIADRFGQQFVKEHLVLCFSTLKDNYSDAEKAVLLGLTRDGYEVLPLTRLDLDPYDLFERFEGLPNQYDQTLQQLAANARALNLAP